jgi:hypothetical protein
MAVAKGEDTYDLLSHIAWTDVILPRLEKEIVTYSTILVNEALGTPIPGNITREQVAGRAYGIRWVQNLLERILKDGKRGLEHLQTEGIALSNNSTT